jgi:hypothetical protein
MTFDPAAELRDALNSTSESDWHRIQELCQNPLCLSSLRREPRQGGPTFEPEELMMQLEKRGALGFCAALFLTKQLLSEFLRRQAGPGLELAKDCFSALEAEILAALCPGLLEPPPTDSYSLGLQFLQTIVHEKNGRSISESNNLMCCFHLTEVLAHNELSFEMRCFYLSGLTIWAWLANQPDREEIAEIMTRSLSLLLEMIDERRRR